VPATFSTAFPTPGRRGLVTQCGCLGLAALILLTGLPLGVSGVVSVGNTADLTPKQPSAGERDRPLWGRIGRVQSSPVRFCGGADVTAEAAWTADMAVCTGI
jgi:hypothetical protein